MNPISPIPLEYLGDGAFAAKSGSVKSRCDRSFAVHEIYPLVVHEERSTNSHNHYHAAVSEAWKTLPENLTARFPSADHLRKYALIKAGYADECSIVCDTAKDALSCAAFIKTRDDMAVVVVRDTTIKVFTAKSQSARALDKQTFQQSKQAVLDIVAEMVGISADALSTQTNAAERTKGHERNDPLQESSAGMAPGADGEQQAGQTPAQPGLLPLHWEKDYALALGRALKPESLPKYAKQFWDQHQGWEKHKNGPDAHTAIAIYDAFKNHFHNKEAREAILNEVGAL